MNAQDIKPGKRVWLDTGKPTPPMVVKHEAQSGDWTCTYHDENSKLCEHEFAAEQLTDIEPEGDLD